MIKERKGTFQLLEEFAIPYKAPKYTFKESTPELLAAIRHEKFLENMSYRKKNKKILIGVSLVFIVLLRLVYVVTNTPISDFFQ